MISVVFSAHLLCESLVSPEPESPHNNNNNYLQQQQQQSFTAVKRPEAPPFPVSGRAPPQLSLERSFSAEEEQQKRRAQRPLLPARVYTITGQQGELMSGRGSRESVELDVLKERSCGVGGRAGIARGGLSPSPSSPSSPASSSPTTTSTMAGHHHGGGSGSRASSGHHHGNHHHHHHLPPQAPPLQASVSAHNIRSWGAEGGGRGEVDVGAGSGGAPSRSQGSLDLESTSREAGESWGRG